MKTSRLYNENAAQWQRDEPVSLSDYTGRPPVLEMARPFKGKDILDLGCGEGYVARQILKEHPNSIIGVDISEEMVSRAVAQSTGYNSDFVVGNATDIQMNDNQFDTVIAVFVYNYLSVDETFSSFKEVYRVLKPGGKFVFSVPHPFFPFGQYQETSNFHFNFGEKNYLSARNEKAEGKILRRDKIELPVQMQHKLIEDYFSAFSEAGFSKLPSIRELRVLPEHLELDDDFFRPLVDKPLHMAFSIHK